MSPDKKPKEIPDGEWQDSDTIDASPEMQDIHEDFVISHLEEHDPEFLKMMKRFGFDAHESSTQED